MSKKKIIAHLETDAKLLLVNNPQETNISSRIKESISESNDALKNAETITLEAKFMDFSEKSTNGGRFYNRESFLEEFERVKLLAEKNQLFASADHPEDDEEYIVKSGKIAGIITKLWYDEKDDSCWVRIKLIPTIVGGGHDLMVVVKNGGVLSVSLRALGFMNDKTKEAYVDSIYTIDVVAMPGMESSTTRVVDFESKKRLSEAKICGIFNNPKQMKKKTKRLKEAASDFSIVENLVEKSSPEAVLSELLANVGGQEVTEFWQHLQDDEIVYENTASEDIHDYMKEFPEEVEMLLDAAIRWFESRQIRDFVENFKSNVLNESVENLEKQIASDLKPKLEKLEKPSVKDLENIMKEGGADLKMIDGVISELVAMGIDLETKELEESYNPMNAKIGDEVLVYFDDETEAVMDLVTNVGMNKSTGEITSQAILDEGDDPHTISFDKEHKIWILKESSEKLFESMGKKLLTKAKRLKESKNVEVLVEIKENPDVGGNFLAQVYMNDEPKGTYWSKPEETEEQFRKRVLPLIEDDYKHYGVVKLKESEENLTLVDFEKAFEKEFGKIGKSAHIKDIKMTIDKYDIATLDGNSKILDIKKELEENGWVIEGSIEDLKESSQGSNASKLAKEYEFERADEFFDYIWESKINGQRKQAKELYGMLDVAGKKEYLQYAALMNHEVDHLFENRTKEEGKKIFESKLQESNLGLTPDEEKLAVLELSNPNRAAGAIDRISTKISRDRGYLDGDDVVDLDGYKNIISQIHKIHSKQKLQESSQGKSASELAKDYDFEYDWEFFDYIWESKINGQRKQAKELYGMLDVAGKKEYLEYAQEMNHETKHLFESKKQESQESNPEEPKLGYIMEKEIQDEAEWEKFAENTGLEIEKLQESKIAKDKKGVVLGEWGFNSESKLKESKRSRVLEILKENSSTQKINKEFEKIVEAYPNMDVYRQDKQVLENFKRLSESQRKEISDSVMLLTRQEMLNALKEYE